MRCSIVSMTEALLWIEGEAEDGPGGVAWAEGDNSRVYSIQSHGDGQHKEWKTVLSYPGAHGAIARGWGLTLDEVKRIAEEWEAGFRRYDMSVSLRPR